MERTRFRNGSSTSLFSLPKILGTGQRLCRRGGNRPFAKKIQGIQQSSGVALGPMWCKINHHRVAALVLKFLQPPGGPPYRRVPLKKRHHRQFQQSDPMVLAADVRQFVGEDRLLGLHVQRRGLAPGTDRRLVAARFAVPATQV